MAFKFLGPLREPGHDAQADAFEAAPPQLGQAARAHIGLAREREHERSTIGPFAPVVAVAIDITEHVEQRTRPAPGRVRSSETKAGSHAQGEAAVARHGRQRLGRQRLEAKRPRQEVDREQRLEDRPCNVARIAVADRQRLLPSRTGQPPLSRERRGNSSSAQGKRRVAAAARRG
jgi:hypothetical protein